MRYANNSVDNHNNMWENHSQDDLADSNKDIHDGAVYAKEPCELVTHSL